MLNGAETTDRQMALASHIYNSGLVSGLFADTILRISAPFTKTYALHALVLSVSQPVSALLLSSQKLYPVGVQDADGFTKGSDYLWRADIVLPPIATEHAMDVVVASMYAKFDQAALDNQSAVPILAVAAFLGIEDIAYRAESYLRSHLTSATAKDFSALLYTPHAPLYTAFLFNVLASTPQPSADRELVGVFADLQWDMLKSVLESAKMQHEHERFEFAKEVLRVRNDKAESVVVSIGGPSGIMLLRRGDKKNKKSIFGGLVGPACDIDIRFSGEESRKWIDAKTDKDKREKFPLYFDGETVSGTISLRAREGKRVEHNGIRVQFIGKIDLPMERGSNTDFLSLGQELASPGEFRGLQTFNFEFKNVEKQYESYLGMNVKLRYFIRVTIHRRLADVVRERDLWVYSYRLPPEQNHPIKMEVGIEDCLHIEFEYSKARYHLRDVIVGKIYFVLVRIKIKYMELSIIRRETCGSVPTQINDSETVTKFEIMDGAPVKGEIIPIRLFLSGFELTPTFRDVNKKFSVRYYLNLVLVDEENRRYFKQQEITVFRRAEDDGIVLPAGAEVHIASEPGTTGLNSAAISQENLVATVTTQLTQSSPSSRAKDLPDTPQQQQQQPSTEADATATGEQTETSG
ncbi:Vacuolar protein sorting-associated protein 26 [Sorochytrium milnesiophthora]